MILINQLKVKPQYSLLDVTKKVASILKILPEDIVSIQIERESIDARKKPELFMVLSVACEVKHESNVLKRINNNQVSKYNPVVYDYTVSGEKPLNNRPVIVGAGPAGLFCAYYLALNGYTPIVLERGLDVDTRSKNVEDFWNGGPLLKNSNVLFGEGGAGTFSDGKLNTLVKDKNGRNKEVLKTFIKFGANPSILYEAKPHVGTDVLKVIVKGMREDIISRGGEFRFNACVTGFEFENNSLKNVIVNDNVKIPADVCVLAIGHSARDTFEMLYNKGFALEQKDFAVGLRIEHKQKTIDEALLSTDPDVLRKLPHASYKLVYNAKSGRGVYSFCMCPGGYVVNASSEPGRLCVNGMSYSGRNGENANSAIVVTVSKTDFNSNHPLAGIEFQRKLEENAYNVGNGSIPVESYKDFKADINDDLNLDDFDFKNIFTISPQTKGLYTKGKVSSILPENISKDLIEGIEYFDNIIPGFSDDNALLSGVESRTSSPVRITRDENFVSLNYKGIYPSGEGAGYAGGITSAAMDGIKVFEAITKVYRPMEKINER